ncbi:MAG: hypothetical protein EZS28_024526, partial [Streblomastix strix]
ASILIPFAALQRQVRAPCLVKKR